MFLKIPIGIPFSLKILTLNYSVDPETVPIKWQFFQKTVNDEYYYYGFVEELHAHDALQHSMEITNKEIESTKSEYTQKEHVH